MLWVVVVVDVILERRFFNCWVFEIVVLIVEEFIFGFVVMLSVFLIFCFVCCVFEIVGVGFVLWLIWCYLFLNGILLNIF